MVKFDPIPMIKSIRIKLGKLKLNACCSLHEIELKVDIWMIKLNSKLNKLIESSCMSFMNGNKLRVNMHARDQVNSDLTWHFEANCMNSNWKWTHIPIIKSDSKLTWQVETKCMLYIAWNQIKSKHAFQRSIQFESNLANRS